MARGRRSIRLKGYDYAQPGSYFVTIRTQDREMPFGEVVNGQMRRNDCGEMIQRVWGELPRRFPESWTETFIVMPNHVHGVLSLSPSKSFHRSLGTIVGAFKSITAFEYLEGVRSRGWAPFRKRLWQRNYYEHIIRTDEGLERIREYICENPARWHSDPENPAAGKVGDDGLDDILDCDLHDAW